jgi:hypothetical protein
MRIFLLFFLFVTSSLYAQDSSQLKPLLLKDTFSKKITVFKPRPARSAFLSAIVPGAGQIYNKKYWKAPIVWAGLAAFTYMYFSNNSEYQSAKTSYLSLLDTVSTNNIAYNGSINLNQVTQYKNNYRNNRDLALVLGVLFYGINIIDATIDAHLMSFDVSDNLSMKVQPSVIELPQSYAFGGGLTFSYLIKKKNKSIPKVL